MRAMPRKLRAMTFGAGSGVPVGREDEVEILPVAASGKPPRAVARDEPAEHVRPRPAR